MELIDVAVILLPIAGMFLWNRTEANADRRDMNQKIQASQERFEASQERFEANFEASQEMIEARIEASIRLIQEKIDSNMEQTRAMISAIQLEIKDFHGRLCSIEAKKYK